MEGERVNRVIDEHDVCKLSLVENSHVFYVEIVLFEAARPVVTGLDQLSSRIEVVYYRVSVFLLRSGENDHLKVLIRSLEALFGVWSYVDAGVDRVWLSRKVERYNDIWIFSVDIVNAVDQRLVEVEYNGLCLVGRIKGRQID